MCNTSKCPYEGTNGECTVPKVPEDALCYHPKVDAHAVDSSFVITGYMAERQVLRIRQQAICDEIMIAHDRNTADGHERLMTDWRKRRQVIIDKIAKDLPDVSQVVQKIKDAPWEPLEGKEEDAQRISDLLQLDYAEAEVKIVILDPGFPTKEQIDAMTTGTDKVSRIRACRRIMHLGLKEALAHVNQLYY